MGGILIERDDRLLIQGTEIGDIAFIEGLGVFGQHHIAVIGHGGRRHAGTIAPEQFLLLFG
jgi:hypothetical protein